MKKLILILCVMPTLCFSSDLDRFEAQFRKVDPESIYIANIMYKEHERAAMEKYPNDPFLRAVYLFIKVKNFTEGKFE